MSWFFSGDHNSLRIGLDHNGYGFIGGIAKEHKLLTVNEYDEAQWEFKRSIPKAEFGWDIYCWNEHFSEIWPTQLSRNVRDQPDISQCSLKFHGENEICDGEYQGGIWAQIVLPKSRFDDVANLMEKVFLHDNLAYQVMIDFSGFPLKRVSPNKPTFKEFLIGMSFDDHSYVYISNEVDFTIKRK